MDKEWIWPAADPCNSVLALDWLTQPVATVLAACIALVAAGIAYLGVLKTTGTTRRENRRTEKVAVLSEGMTAVESNARAIYQVAQATDAETRATIMAALASTGRMNEIYDAIALTQEKLLLFGFRDARQKTVTVAKMFRLVWDAAVADPGVAVDMGIIDPHYKAATASFVTAMAKLK